MTGTALDNVYVTGAASGLGQAIARAVVKAGGAVAVLDRTQPEDDFPNALVDLADARAAESAVAELVTRCGPPTAVVTAAGTDACGPLATVPAEDWERTIKVNLIGTAAVVRAALPHLERVHGTVVTVGSTLGLRAAGDATAYCASKFGIVGFTRALAMEMAGRVGVTMLVPGGMRTHFFDGRDEQYRPGPDAQLADPDDVAAAALLALQQPHGVELRELVVTTSTEPSWP